MAAVKMLEMLRPLHVSRHTTGVAKHIDRSLLASRDTKLT